MTVPRVYVVGLAMATCVSRLVQPDILRGQGTILALTYCAFDMARFSSPYRSTDMERGKRLPPSGVVLRSDQERAAHIGAGPQGRKRWCTNDRNVKNCSGYSSKYRVSVVNLSWGYHPTHLCLDLNSPEVVIFSVTSYWTLALIPLWQIVCGVGNIARGLSSSSLILGLDLTANESGNTVGNGMVNGSACLPRIFPLPAAVLSQTGTTTSKKECIPSDRELVSICPLSWRYAPISVDFVETRKPLTTTDTVSTD